MAEPYMPHRQIYRPKIGLSTPLNDWLRNEEMLGQYLLLEEPRTLDRPWFQAKRVRSLLEDFRAREDTFVNSMGGRLWLLLNLEVWTRMYLEEHRPLS